MSRLALLDTAAAVEQLHAGGVIAYPTEAVYGLGCDPANETAVRKILTLKGREESAGLVLMIRADSEMHRTFAPTTKAIAMGAVIRKSRGRVDDLMT